MIIISLYINKYIITDMKSLYIIYKYYIDKKNKK